MRLLAAEARLTHSGKTRNLLETKRLEKPSNYLAELEIAAGERWSGGQPIDGEALMC
jgi:hypothetical protein